MPTLVKGRAIGFGKLSKDGTSFVKKLLEPDPTKRMGIDEGERAPPLHATHRHCLRHD